MYNFINSTQDINENSVLISEYFKIYETEGKKKLEELVETKIKEQLEIINNNNLNTLTDIKEILNLSELEEVMKLKRLKEIIPNILNENVIYQDLNTKQKEQINLLINSVLAMDVVNNNPLTKSILENYKNELNNLSNNINIVLNFEKEIKNFLEENPDLKEITNLNYLKNWGINIDNNSNVNIEQKNKNLGIN